jgi:hypothetical protein
MRILVAIKRVVDVDVKVRAKSDGSGVAAAARAARPPTPMSRRPYGGRLRRASGASNGATGRGLSPHDILSPGLVSIVYANAKHHAHAPETCTGKHISATREVRRADRCNNRHKSSP